MLCAGAVVYGPVFFLAPLAPSFPSVPLFLSLLSLPLRGVVPWCVHPARVCGVVWCGAMWCHVVCSWWGVMCCGMAHDPLAMCTGLEVLKRLDCD